MMKHSVTRFVVPILAGIGALALTAIVSAAVQGPARDVMVAYGCEWRLLSDATCYPDKGFSGLYEESLNELVAKEELDKELAPIIAEQKRLEASKRDWEKNSRSSDLDAQKSYILGCERDKLARMQEGKDVSSWDCRKGSALR